MDRYVSDYKILSNEKLAADIFRMRLEGSAEAFSRPGQFLNIKIEGLYLRRPISVCDYDEDTVTIIYKVVGRGTGVMSDMKPGQTLNIMIGLGNGFDASKSGDRPLLIGGGVGTPPMYGLCKRLVAEGKKPTVILGFNSKDDVFYRKEFEELGAKVYVTTVDGSEGTKGFVTDVMKELKDYTFFYTCGPGPMLKAVYDCSATEGELSFEERMGCGFGACVGCTCKTKYGNKRICTDGPVLEKEEVIW